MEVRVASRLERVEVRVKWRSEAVVVNCSKAGRSGGRMEAESCESAAWWTLDGEKTLFWRRDDLERYRWWVDGI